MEYRKLSDLKKLPGNPRIIRDKQFRTLCDSIRDNREYFEARPLILSDRTGELVIIAGNQRWEAARSLKLAEVPTHLIEGLTVDKEREITIRDNASGGEWDFAALAAEWSDLPLAEWGVDLPKSAIGGEVELKEIDVSEVKDRFWMSVAGPLPAQKDAIEKLVAALQSLSGVEVQVGFTEVNANEFESWTA